MPEASNEVTIARPPDVVFNFLAEAENDRQWRTTLAEISKISGAGVGTRYHQVMKGPAGREIEADFEITQLEPNRLIAFRTVSGPIQPEGRYELSDAGGGSTRVRQWLGVELGGLKKAMSPIVKKSMETEVGDLERLKSVLEGGAA
jgi:uncharacterized membrane protein